MRNNPPERLARSLVWHALPVDDVLAAIGASRSGLADDEAARRLERYGANRLAPAAPVSAFKILVAQLRSVIVVLLLAAAVVSLLMGDRVEAAAIGAVLVINTVLGFATEFRARRAMEALLKLDSARASVMRAGQLRSVAAETLVPGDIVRLDAGQRVPADARLIETTDLRVDEAALTGESLPVSKRAEDTVPEDAPLAERPTMVYKGTVVSAGTGTAVLVATGDTTEIGRVGKLVAGVDEKPTPLERRLDALGGRLAWLAIGIAAVIATLGALQGAPIGLVVEIGIALAVAAVPEALPVVATIALAVGVHRMARRQALVRRLPAVEALGSTTVVCTDKTRTLTTGRMTVVRLWTSGAHFRLQDGAGAWQDARVRHALEVGVLSSRPQPQISAGEQGGDPVDSAMLEAGRRAGFDRADLVRQHPEAGLVPFSSERKLMASFHGIGDRLDVYAKGAPRRILESSDSVLTPDGTQALDDAIRERVMAANEALAGDGLRVLALATGPARESAESAVTGLTFIGLIGLADPPAPGVRETIARLRRAGLRTLMLTGDQRLTAQSVGRELNLLGGGADDSAKHDSIIDARDLAKLSEEQLASKLDRVAGFSRIAPEHKLLIVSALQARGAIVAMLGDGVNDAPALRRADVGVAMGLRGTDVAKEAAAIVLQDDRFETVAAAVEEGRVIFDNIRKFVFYLFSCNLAEILVLLIATLAGLPMPLMPLQILWLNMVTDTFPALALAMEPAEPDVMARPPRDPQEAILSRQFLGSVVFHALLITGSTLGAYLLSLEHGEGHARTVAFMTLALAQILHVGNARSDLPLLQPARFVANRFVVAAVVLSIVLQLLAAHYEPLAELLRVTSVGWGDWGLIIGCAAVPVLVGQAVKAHRYGRSES
jgi:Ca2+-transporting ATPase